MALELAAREHGLDLLKSRTRCRTEGLGNSPGEATIAHDPPARNPQPSTRPCHTRRAGTGTKLPNKWPFPTREDISNRSPLPNPRDTRVRNTPSSARSGPGRRHAELERMTSAPRGPTAKPLRTTNGHSLHFGTRYPTQSTARGPQSSPGSAASHGRAGTRQERSRTAPHGPRAGQ